MNYAKMYEGRGGKSLHILEQRCCTWTNVGGRLCYRHLPLRKEPPYNYQYHALHSYHPFRRMTRVSCVWEERASG